MCSELIWRDEVVRKLWREIASRGEFVPDAFSALNTLAGTVAGLHFALPKEAATRRYERRRRLERAIAKFRAEVETYQRQSGDMLPTPNDVLYRHGPLLEEPDHVLRKLPTLGIDEYLQELDSHLRDAEGGTWIHPMLVTRAGHWSSKPNSAAVRWIVRALDMVGTPRVSAGDRSVFLDIAVRLSELFQQSQPPCDITPTRKDFENHEEFVGQGAQQWRRDPSPD